MKKNNTKATQKDLAKPRKNAHLSYDERLEIQNCLTMGMTFKAIALKLGKAQTTISREVKKHILAVPPSVIRKDVADNPITETCKLLLRSPFVCNPCKRRNCACVYVKHHYYAKEAQKAYEALLVEAREGIPLNKQEFYDLDKIITEGVKNGQHVYHILQTNDLSSSKTSVYRYLKNGMLSAKAIDFPRVVKFKQRGKKAEKYVPSALKIGRTYIDFLAFKEAGDISAWVEMDTVIGRIGGKVIVTFNFVPFNFMFGLLADNKFAYEVSTKISELKLRLRTAGKTFGDIFPLILTDNGGEFSDVHSIEQDLDGNTESRLFFCDPYKSSQKPFIEKNHTLFRDIVPSGASFENFTQDIVNTIFSHVNSVKRKNLGGKTPYEMFSFLFGTDVSMLLGIEQILPELVIQSPKLLKNIMKI